jgi:uncharacterized membrane protein YccC
LSVTATYPPFSFAGFPAGSWAFAIRIWIASIIALGISFWLQLEVPSSAMMTVAILAEPTRGQALEKAGYRLIATIVGVAASVAIVGLLSQTRDLLLAAFAIWLGLCVYAAGLFDGYRAYAAILSGYTVAFIAVQQIDNPQHVFESGMARGAAIAVGVLSITLVNDLLLAPDRHPQLAAQLAALHRRVRDYAKTTVRTGAADAIAAAALTREIVALRPDITSLAAEASGGRIRSAAARSTTVALVMELHAVRALAALPPASDPISCEALASMLDRVDKPASPVRLVPGDGDKDGQSSLAAARAWALAELLRRDEEVRLNLAALRSATRPLRSWRAPLYRSHRVAWESGMRAGAYFALASAFFVLAGWPSASASLSLVAVVIGLGATTPSPRTFTAIAFVAAPIAIVLAGVLEFVILNGVSDFPLLALGFAPFIIAAALLVTRLNPVLSALGKINLFLIPAVFAPSNPQNYDPQAFLSISLFVCLAIGLLLAAQLLIPPVSGERRRQWLIASARHELDLVLGRSDRRYAPEEAMFRDATRLGQIAAVGATDRPQRDCVAETLSYFDEAAAIRLCAARLAPLAQGRLARLAAEARTALVERNARLIRAGARGLHQAGRAGDALAAAARAALIVAGCVIEAAPATAVPVTRSGA